MAWISGKRMTLGGSLLERGDPIPEATIRTIPHGRLGALTRLNLIQQIPDPVPDGEMCEECGEGPFQRLASHMTRSHSDSEED